MGRTADRQNQHGINPAEHICRIVDQFDTTGLHLRQVFGDPLGKHQGSPGITQDHARTLDDLIGIHPDVIKTPGEFDAVR